MKQSINLTTPWSKARKDLNLRSKFKDFSWLWSGSWCTDVCIVLASGTQISVYYFHLMALTSFHRGCILGTPLTTCINQEYI